jgi:tight adherence protein B
LNEPWLVYVLIFGAGLLGVEGAYWVIYRSRTAQKSINRRLALGEKLSSSTAVLETLRRERGIGDYHGALSRQLNELLVQTGLRITLGGLVAAVVGLACVVFLVASIFMGVGVLPLGIAVAVAPTVAFIVLKIIRANRIAKFGEQLPDAVDIIVRGVRVGHPFSTAISLVARELPDPIGTEFGITADEITFGQDIATAITNLYRRVGQDDLLYLVVVIGIQTQTGGNLAIVLARLSKLIRERSKVRLKIKALSAEGRMSGWVLSATPLILFLIIKLMMPTYFDDFAAHPLFSLGIAYAVISLIIGNVMIYRMVNFKF